MRPIVRGDGHKIISRLRVIVCGQAKRSAMINVTHGAPPAMIFGNCNPINPPEGKICQIVILLSQPPLGQ
jgi:hypothetical protein